MNAADSMAAIVEQYPMIAGFSAWFVKLWVDLLAVGSGVLAWIVCQYQRKKLGLPPLDREHKKSVAFSGATVAMLALLGLSAFSDSLLQLMLGQERVLLAFVLIHAATDEYADIAKQWKVASPSSG